MATASTSAPTLKEKLKLTMSLLAPLVPSASLQVKQQALTGKILFCFQQNFSCKNQNFSQMSIQLSKISQLCSPRILLPFSQSFGLHEDKFLWGLPLLLMPMLYAIASGAVFRKIFKTINIPL